MENVTMKVRSAVANKLFWKTRPSEKVAFPKEYSCFENEGTHKK